MKILIWVHKNEAISGEISNYFFHCPQCVGFWVGAFLCSINQFTTLFSFDVSVMNIVFLGCLSSGTSFILCFLFDEDGLRIERR